MLKLLNIDDNPKKPGNCFECLSDQDNPQSTHNKNRSSVDFISNRTNVNFHLPKLNNKKETQNDLQNNSVDNPNIKSDDDSQINDLEIEDYQPKMYFISLNMKSQNF